MHLYESTLPSGNAYKVRLLLEQLGKKYDTTFLDIMADPPETRRPEFLAVNPNGRIPVLVLDDGTALPESAAIMFYLAEGTKYLPESRLGRAQVLQWLFFEQYSHEPYIAVYKFCTFWAGFGDRSEEDKKKLKERGQAAIDIMERHLTGKRFFVEDRYSIADIALYAYTMAAETIGFRVDENVSAWLKRVEEQDGWVKVRNDPTGKCPL
ncbi:glutathione S-transferase [Clohesyomyces aquaticus]|uniref:Glutathione S-transferase n=1 Tax=Clohesyomyces aquaticus TaxID=1231657 RepID=A0A1Y1Z3N0_9PLEO|nr:glutathione S-transferase [Clohesyomyces aquaticus]